MKDWRYWLAEQRGTLLAFAIFIVMADLDLGGRAGEAIAAFLALAALDEAGIAQLTQDGIEEFLRDVVGNGDVIDERKLTSRQPGQMHECLQTVFALLGKHEARMLETAGVTLIVAKTPARSNEESSLQA